MGRLGVYLVIKGLFLYSVVAWANVDHYFNSIHKNPNALYAFFKAMPKGGELHYHLAGSVYPETMLAIAAKNNYCLDKKSFVIRHTNERCLGIESMNIVHQPEIYEEIIRKWSLKDFVAGKESANQHFFDSFYKFLTLVFDHRAELLADVIQRAANQREHYLEVMVIPDNAQSTNFGNFKDLNLTQAHQALLANPNFMSNVRFTVQQAKKMIIKARQQLNCSTSPESAPCQVTVKLQYYVLREQPLDKVFAQALNGFLAASQSDDIVGINLVQKESGFIALRDYHQQMKIFNFLHKIYPKVNIALHAGELSPEEVSPNNLSFHIREAILLGHAKRIGHGVAVAYEKKANQLLNYMAHHFIPVEINLTSNEKILDVKGVFHPLNYYLAHKVPVVLSTDDEGILRTDLTRQYVKAAFEQNLNYQQLKAINRNALIYNFLPGKSLWQNNSNYLPIKICQNLDRIECLNFIKQQPKAKLQWQLEKDLLIFEKQYGLSTNTP